MKRREEIESLLAQALREDTPDVFQTVSAPLGSRGEPIRFDPIPRKKRHFAPLLAAACLLLVVGAGSWSWLSEAAVIGVSINPAMEFRVNRWERVIGAAPLNDDGADLLARMDWQNRTLEELAGELADALENRGYLRAEGVEVLVAAQGANSQTALRWAGKVARELEEERERVLVTVREGRVEELEVLTPSPSLTPDLPAQTPTAAPTPSAYPTIQPVPTAPETAGPPPTQSWEDDDWDDDHDADDDDHDDDDHDADDDDHDANR